MYYMREVFVFIICSYLTEDVFAPLSPYVREPALKDQQLVCTDGDRDPYARVRSRGSFQTSVRDKIVHLNSESLKLTLSSSRESVFSFVAITAASCPPPTVALVLPLAILSSS